MIESILIANRGEIARRIGRTCREMGIRTIAVYSDADRDMPSVSEADLALRLGPAPAAESYLDGGKLIALAQGNGAGAIHPGYGFLAENADFREACEQAGLIFIGPPAEVIRTMGDKAAAKQAMEAAGVPIIPGYMGEDQDPETLAEGAARAGYPVLLKAVAGGGGRGIRRVDKEEDLAAALESAVREAQAAFGDGRMMVEKFLPGPRHVEFQVLADGHGKVLHLFERECSVQRRHQKIVEETPSPALDDALRVRMAEAAVLATRTIGYIGAGTVEFMVDSQGAFYFLEMNTRLQVEHPITEMTLGVDLVRLQIEVAGGSPLALEQEQLIPRGHAIECRINAEDPARGFLPSVGPLHAFEFPQGPGLRADSGFVAGGALSPYYDSLLAKLVAWGETREEALRRMARMLENSRVAGIATNLGFLREVIGHPEFLGGAYTTLFLEEHGEALAAPETPPHLETERVLAAAAIDAWLEMHRRRRGGATPSGGGHASSPWEELGEAPRMQMVASRLSRRHAFGSETYETGIEVLPAGGGALDLTVHWNGVPHRVRYHPLPGTGPIPAGDLAHRSGEGVLDLAELQLPLRWDANGGGRWFTLRGRHFHCTSEDPALATGRAAGAEELAQGLCAPLPGKVAKVEVEEGQQVGEGDVLLVLEAMKVEHKITAPFRGMVTGIAYAAGEQVNRGDPLVELVADGLGGKGKKGEGILHWREEAWDGTPLRFPRKAPRKPRQRPPHFLFFR